MAAGYLRIGEFSQRVGVSAERLRAWEKRYGLLIPERSAGGFRLYSDADATRVQRMLDYLQRGASAAEAARLAWEAPAAVDASAEGVANVGRVGQPSARAPAHLRRRGRACRA